MNFLEVDIRAPLRIVEFDPGELAALGRDFIAEIFDSRLTGIIVHGAFPAATVARVVEQLERGACDHVERPSKYWNGRAIGPALHYATCGDLRDYFDQVREFRVDCAALFEGGPGFHTRIDELLTHAHAGRPLSVLHGPAGETYATATIRGLVPTSTMELHVDIEQFKIPTIQHLESRLDTSSLLSYFVLLGTPEVGGRLHVHALRYDDERGPAFARMELPIDEAMREIAAYGELVLPMVPGDMLLFDAGYYFHHVDSIGGSRTRWTQGGFLSRSRDGASVFYWH
jgi:hypothetical protein